jgi:lipoprotein-anchoring transpeptidase ErfK/SrfK
MMVGRRRVFVLSVACALVWAAPAVAQDPPEPVIADGVTIAGVAVGGLTAAEASEEVRAFFTRPLDVALGSEALSVKPYRLGARAGVANAVAAALASPADTAVPLRVRIVARTLRAWVNRRAAKFRRGPVSARIVLAGLRPRIVPQRPGRALVKLESRSRLRAALLKHRRTVRLPARRLRPAITVREVGPAVVIRRGSRRLTLYRGAKAGKMRVVRVFPVAVGQPRYPTPLGSFTIRTKTRNPWWYPPNKPWAEGASPVPPGPGNPLGTRWMGLGGGVGIHGTYNSGSIGTAASHGCIRMHIASAEWLFERVRLGTPVWIVAS